jgi:DnaJ-class molecular chaperone
MNACIVRPGYRKRMPGQGMPLMDNSDQFGDLLIEFEVEYPHALNTKQKSNIKDALITNHNNTNKKNNQRQTKSMNMDE